MIEVIVNRPSFEYDIHSLVKSFFPREDVQIHVQDTFTEDTALRISVEFTDETVSICLMEQGEEKESGASVINYAERKETKNRLKRQLYQLLCAYTGQTLPWGTLTGIRPAKIAMGLIEQGMSNVETAEYMRNTYLASKEKVALSVMIANRERYVLRNIDYKDGYSLYVGIPFCPSICLYCSFSSYPLERWRKQVDQYLDALCKELDYVADRFRDKKLNTVYIGGGTPTTLEPYQLDRLLTRIQSKFDTEHLQEFTVEAGRPDSITREKLQVLLDHGVDRISVNPQSLEDHVLTAIGRRHTARDVEEAMALATGMGFPHVNMDLIAGLPEDTPEGFRRTLDKCLSYGADNITVHTLSLKKGSRILLENFTIPSAEAVGEMLDYANAALRQADFHPYYLYRQKYMSGSFENTGWCISGAEGLYNIYIMEELHSILSLGAGGSTKMVDPVHQRIERVFHTKYPTEYIQRSEKLEENLSAFRQFHENMRG